jgi:phage terminase large subunit-like protein
VSAYEEYGMQADVSYIKEKMEESNYRFTIKPVGGNLSKVDRIRKLIPIFEEGRFYLPKKLYKTDFEKKSQDLIKQFLEDEYETFPVGLHDDMLDCMARILDNEVGASFPISNEVELSTLSQQIPAGF